MKVDQSIAQNARPTTDNEHRAWPPASDAEAPDSCVTTVRRLGLQHIESDSLGVISVVPPNGAGPRGRPNHSAAQGTPRSTGIYLAAGREKAPISQAGKMSRVRMLPPSGVGRETSSGPAPPRRLPSDRQLRRAVEEILNLVHESTIHVPQLVSLVSRPYRSR